MLLTIEERKLFLKYAKTQVESYEAVIEQMNLLNLPEVVIKDFKIKLAAYRVVHDDIKNVIEEFFTEKDNG